jgi:molecular chaperone IbpA
MTLNSLLAQFDAIHNHPGFLGFDPFLERVTNNLQHSQDSYPPHNVVYDKNEDDEESYIIELALAGYKEEDIKIKVEDDQLSIEGSGDKDERKYQSKGIAQRKFRKSFTLGEYLVVRKAEFENGLLSVHIDKVIPEDKKPRTIQINPLKKDEEKSLLTE